ncbi:hypothetical protein GCM10023317_88830 [Actinopolymorpha pittospori]
MTSAGTGPPWCLGLTANQQAVRPVYAATPASGSPIGATPPAVIWGRAGSPMLGHHCETEKLQQTETAELGPASAANAPANSANRPLRIRPYEPIASGPGLPAWRR